MSRVTAEVGHVPRPDILLFGTRRSIQGWAVFMNLPEDAIQERQMLLLITVSICRKKGAGIRLRF